MRQHLLLLLFATLAAPAARAQTAPTTTATTAAKDPGRLTGRVVDATTQQPVEFATVVLLPATGSAPLLSGTTDAAGWFELRNLPTGAFRLQISFVGYQTRLEPIVLEAAAQELGKLPLVAAPSNLAGVTVTGERPIVESRPGHVVYNADQDASNAGGTAADVLRKTPLVNLDGEGNVQLRGTGNVRILLNNKSSALLAGNLADALKQIPADQIKAIEVVTSPSARYDGEGSGGIINIVLKQNNLKGVNGNAGISSGNRNQGLNGSLNGKREKFGLATKLSGFRNVYPFKSRTERTSFLADGTTGQLLERTTSRDCSNGGYGQAEFTFDPTPQHSITLGGTGNLNDSRSPRQLFNRYQGQSRLDTLYVRDIRQQHQNRNYDLNGSYTHTFGPAQPGREWVVLAQHSNSRRNQHYRLNQFPGAAGAAPAEYREASLNRARNLQTTFQTDYLLPFKATNKLEVGAKHTGRQARSDYHLDTLLVAAQPDFVRSVRRSNRFNYRQKVLAGYGTYNGALGRTYTFGLGMRLERTTIAGEFQDGAGHFSSHYFNVLPSLSATRTLKKKGQTLRLTYSRRIQRPQIYFLNPYVNQVTPNSVNFGNPQLRPELADLVELTYSMLGEKASLTASGFTRRVGNSIERYSRYNQALVRNETTYGNLATVYNYGLNLYGSWKPVKAWDISSNVNGDYTRLRSPVLRRINSRPSLNANVNASCKLNETYSAQGYGGFWTGGVELQARYSGGLYYGLSLKKLLLAEKADLTLGANNFLAPGREYTSTTTTPDFVNYGSFYQYQRNVRLSFNYRFGQLASGPRQRRTIENNDSKPGGG